MDTETTDVKPTDAASSTATEPDVKPPASLGDFVKQEMAEKSPAVEPVEPTPEADDSAVVETEETKPAVEPVEQPKVETHDETKPVPYARFKEVNSKFRELEAKHAKVASTLEDPDVKAALDVLQLIKTAPEKALEQLVPIVEHLKQLKGEAFPSDIQTMLDEGTITKAAAVELTQLRHQTKASKMQLDQQRQQTAKSASEAVLSTWATWDAEHRKTDTEFQPGSPKWKMVNSMLEAEVVKNGFPTTQAAAIEYAERVYTAVNELVNSSKPAPARRKVLTSSNSTTEIAELDPTKMSLKDYIKLGLQKKG